MTERSLNDFLARCELLIKENGEVPWHLAKPLIALVRELKFQRDRALAYRYDLPCGALPVSVDDSLLKILNEAP